MARRTAAALWLLRLSITTMSPRPKVGTRNWITHARKLSVAAAFSPERADEKSPV
jgi:hypothetical protein